MTTLKGRAATPVRPGICIKQVLLGQVPLATGEIVSEAAITDLHSAYKELVKRENALRPKVKRLRGMTYRSFVTLFKFAVLLSLVEHVRDEPMAFPPPGGPLYRVEKPDGIHAVISTRRIFKITSVGSEDEKSWTNLCKAWIEGWTAPQKVEYALPPAKPVPRRRPPVMPKPYKWVAIPSPRQFRLLLGHLESLAAVGITDADVAKEVRRLYMRLGDWLIWIDDALSDAKALDDKPTVTRMEEWNKEITSMMEFFDEDNIEGAMASLRGLL